MEREVPFLAYCRAHGLATPQARATAFYRLKTECLASDVLVAEEARKASRHSQVDATFDRWCLWDNMERFDAKLNSRIDRLGSGVINRQRFNAGIAGLALIEQVDANSEAKKAGKVTLLFDERTAKVQDVADYQELQGYDLGGTTITGGEINFDIEAALNRAVSNEIRGNLDMARHDMTYALVVSSQDTRVATQSARAVAAGRLGRMTHSLYTMKESVSIANRYLTRHPNPHRMATLGLWGLAASMDGDYTGKLSDRAKLFAGSLACLATASLQDFPEVKKAYLQHTKR